LKNVINKLFAIFLALFAIIFIIIIIIIIKFKTENTAWMLIFGFIGLITAILGFIRNIINK
jgi:hypothetical protein